LILSTATIDCSREVNRLTTMSIVPAMERAKARANPAVGAEIEGEETTTKPVAPSN
jgi:hypothetical protein